MTASMNARLIKAYFKTPFHLSIILRMTKNTPSAGTNAIINDGLAKILINPIIAIIIKSFLLKKTLFKGSFYFCLFNRLMHTATHNILLSIAVHISSLKVLSSVGGRHAALCITAGC